MKRYFAFSHAYGQNTADQHGHDIGRLHVFFSARERDIYAREHGLETMSAKHKTVRRILSQARTWTGSTWRDFCVVHNNAEEDIEWGFGA